MQISESGTPWEAQGLTPPDYVTLLLEQPGRAAQFTRMLHEIHLPLADQLAESLPMDGVERLLDVGGGSGVMSLALLRRHPRLQAVVLDIENVCAVGREIAALNSLQDRIDYQACDFTVEELPSGFDMILYCDVGHYDEGLFRKFRRTLNPGGLLVIVDKFGTERGLPHGSRAHWGLLSALSGSAPKERFVEDVEALLRRVDFKQPAAAKLPAAASRWSSGWTRITAHV